MVKRRNNCYEQIMNPCNLNGTKNWATPYLNAQRPCQKRLTS